MPGRVLNVHLDLAERVYKPKKWLKVQTSELTFSSLVGSVRFLCQGYPDTELLSQNFGRYVRTCSKFETF